MAYDTPVRIRFSPLLAHMEADSSITFLCCAAASIRHRRNNKSKQNSEMHLFETNCNNVFQELQRIMPRYIKETTGGLSVLSSWLQNIPEDLRATLENGTHRDLRMHFLKWAIQEFADPEITFTFDTFA